MEVNIDVYFQKNFEKKMLKTINDLNLSDKRVGVRVDLNVPLSESGEILDDNRIIAIIPTIKKLLEKGAKILLFSHLGRPKEYDEFFSLKNVAKRIQKTLNIKTNFVDDFDNVNFKKNEITVFENTRFLEGETENSKESSKKIASIIDVFVMDAFATAHREHASTYGVVDFVKEACIGPLVEYEINNLKKIFNNSKPITAIVAGAKISSKLGVLNNIFDKIDNLIVGGGIANTFLVAKGIDVKKSLVEKDLVEKAKLFLNKAEKENKKIILPSDVVVSDNVNGKGKLKNLNELSDTDCIFDFGKKSLEEIDNIVKSSKTIIWSGTLGVYEKEEFAIGTKHLVKSISKSNAFVAAGGGDTVAAINMFGNKDDISYISTGGSAFLEFLEKGSLVAIKKIEEKN